MQQWSLLGLLVILVLLNGCTFYNDSQTVGAQAAQLPAGTQKANTAAATEISAMLPPMPSTTENPDSLDTCPVTLPPDPPFIPPSPYPPELAAGGEFWYGTDSLWTVIPAQGIWSGLPKNPDGYSQKVFWWRKGYFWKDEPEPQLTVTGRRLDEPAEALKVSKATNAFAADIQSAMLVGVDFPTLGCWEISGRYADIELSFIVWVAP